MSEVFIAYKREDRRRAEQLRAFLHERGVSTWFDAELEIGVEWRPQIARQIDCAESMIVCWSRAACASPHVREEARLGLARGMLAPVLFERCEIAPPFGVVTAADLSDWRGEAEHAAARALLVRLAALLGRAPLSDSIPSPARRRVH
ncbi:MAG TPA: toll/interleukin-1 receptor domain-containing protein [Vitreimonas sp.]|uniref:toll/interleukin-1 receptor domain-containing protein n=1 Tax=Vitreimonas sp. TaxID=3069702 RepID=UPI002D36683C|nr:toll/interleukin-1 receptor domain-containing protein [Vitreimonas sp.]HYD87898.1 toll/interleukin-1 receptor domain-containing protein [Vitreimonas sp.]